MMRFNKRNAAFIVIALLIVCGMNLKLGMIPVSDSEQWGLVFHLLRDLTKASYGNGLVKIVEMLFLFWGIERIHEEKKHLNFYAFLIISTVLGAPYLIARTYCEQSDWNIIFSDYYAIVRFVICLISVSLIILVIVANVYLAVLNSGEMVQCESNEAWTHRKYIKCVLLFLLCWVPVYIILFPGSSFQDTVTQIMQFFHFPTQTAGIELTDGINTVFSEHHPVLLTLIWGSFMKLGLLIGDVKYGVGIYSAFQMIYLACVFTYCIRSLSSLGLCSRINRVVFAFFAFSPCIMVSTMNMVKDVLFASAVLLFCVILMNIYLTDGDYLRNKRHMMLSILSIVWLMITKKTGLYIFAVTLVPLVILCHKLWKQLLVVVVASLVLFSGMYSTVLFRALNVAPSGKQEMLGLLFQQTNRYVYDYQEDVTEEEKNIIDSVLDYEFMTQTYCSDSVDQVKATYRTTTTSNELSQYFQVYLRQLKKHPDAYIKAFIEIYYRYFAVDEYNTMSYYSWMNISDCRQEYLENHGYSYEDYADLEIVQSNWQVNAQNCIRESSFIIENIPIVGIIFKRSGIVYVTLLLAFFLFYGKKFRVFWACMPVWLSMATLFIAPVVDTRYTLPLFFSFPLLLASLYLKRTEWKRANTEQLSSANGPVSFIMKVPVLKVCYSLYERYREIIMYLIFGTLAFFISVSSYSFCILVLNMQVLTANVISWILAVLFAYITNRTWVFSDKAYGFGNIVKELLSFGSGRVVTLLLEEGILFILVEIMNFNSLVVKIFAQIVVIVANYIISKLFVFRKK